MSQQQTIQNPVELRGRGLFTGQPVTARFCPAPVDAGIVFVRSDCDPAVSIPAQVDHVARRARRTTLANGSMSVETVEHCLSACTGLGIDNITVELNAGEVPGVDGSCLPFVEKLREAGLETQDTERRPLRVTEPVRVAEGDTWVVALPAPPDLDALEIVYDLDYGEGSPIRWQHYRLRVTPDAFRQEIAPARTFLLKAEAEQFRAAGLGTHLTYQDVVVFGDDGPIENVLRFPDECVRHKILDLLGDLTLLGRPIIGCVYARKSGHSLNHELVRRLGAQYREQNLRSRIVSGEPVFDVRRIQRILPHRYPFLMVDRVVEIDGARRAVGVKNVTVNEEFFTGHYPGQPIMPGVLIIEAMAQLGGVLLSQELEHTGKVAVLLSLDKVKFRRPVTPGDQLILEAEAIRVKSRTGHVKCHARVGDALVAEAIIKFMMVDADPL
ncbi:MAG: UDP-3-O-[3-hydroxymyristoyl] N-acetylglucosamine deacetylase [Phycisphaerae bacterium]|nr:UDP-3-O-[3-hydroxymyristoyl] N-acetylglucosamine deacetylase [Phycisphaerae bacterium]